MPGTIPGPSVRLAVQRALTLACRVPQLAVATGPSVCLVVHLPAHATLPTDALEAIAVELGEPVNSVRLMPDAGIFNAVYLVGTRFVLRVPRDHPAHFEALEREATVVPVARSVGVRTPALVRYDTSRRRLPVPYVVYERVEGSPLEPAPGDISEPRSVWRDLGRDLALLHQHASTAAGSSRLPQAEELPDPGALVARRVEEGWLTPWDRRWLLAWLEALSGTATEVGKCVRHGDVQASNVMVNGHGAYAALIDWGSACWDDPAHDFAGVPLSVVPSMLAGYRDAGGNEPHIEARIVRRHIQLALFMLPRGAVLGRSWAERPVPMLLETVKFFADAPPGWGDLKPRS